MRQETVTNPEMLEPNPLVSLLRISSHLAGQVEIRAALRSVKTEIENLLPIDHLDVCLVDDNVTWNTSYEVGIRTRWSLSRTPVAISPVRSILFGETDYMLTDNAMEDERYTYEGALAQPIIKHKLRSRVNVAMKVLGRTVGALNCSSRTPGLYDEKTVERVRQIADVLAPYFYSLKANEKAKQAAIVRAEAQAREEGLRQGALELTRVLEQERQRIGMDLHDQTLADLTRIMRDLEKAETPDDKAHVIGSIQDCIQDLRRIIDTAVPTLLDLFGFAHALRIHLERAVEDADATILQVCDETDGRIDRLDPVTRIALYRIAQEGINNAARHSGADRISVTVRCRKGQLKMVIEDNGLGLPGGKSGRHGGKATGGIAHMRTRARLITADFSVSGKDGTRITVKLPMSGEPDEDACPTEPAEWEA
ncbi:GAF domain-containing sensor histidine kinase [Roseibium salinum]|uniref:Sensor histidine kinase n=1 Tax=Roseibium salinum TaxID=1604349 RepID=A0ABT3QXF8_9HYPH|nr:sensor histidine kinase [Roseibium sp. DSM 29163]MCX2721526.1 sensor histidine kinase [Roseibium sp. DSM 29163]MDN3721997.1 sensor histidine kinase [Roseibium salinum]